MVQVYHCDLQYVALDPVLRDYPNLCKNSRSKRPSLASILLAKDEVRAGLTRIWRAMQQQHYPRVEIVL